MYLTLVDQEGNDIVAQPCYLSQCYTHYTTEELKETLDQLLQIKRYEDLSEDDSNFCKPIIFYVLCVVEVYTLCLW